MNDPTIHTKYGRVTGQQWFALRTQEAINEWLTPEALHYIFTRTPEKNGENREIIDWKFRVLLSENPSEAMLQLKGEEIDFYVKQRHIDAQVDKRQKPSRQMRLI